jgi:hypothetical protein
MEVLFKDLYDSEINVSLSWFWDAGFTVKIGDEVNGFVAQTTVQNLLEVQDWLIETVKELYPESWYVTQRQ